MAGTAGEVQLTGGWAIWGKPRGTDGDYRVLESSTEPLDALRFAQILDHFKPGTPPTERGRPDSLPWVTISWMTLGDQPYVGMALQDSTGEVDGYGRPITRTSYFCFPYTSLASGPVSYLGLYRALKEVQLPAPRGALVQVTVPVLDPATLADDVTRLGEAAVSTAAALLLRGSVSILGADASTLEQRLQFLDAVTALLPYGYRAGTTAATWTESGVRHRIKLAFAARPKEGANSVAWRRAQPPPEGIADSAASYYRQFRLLRERPAANHGLTELIGFLARDTTAREFDTPDPAIGGLREFDLPFAVLDDVHRQTADPGELRRVFAASRVTELPADGRRDMLAALIAHGDPADVKMAGAWWDRTATGDPGVLVTALTGPARAFLWRADPVRQTADAYLRLAADHGLADPLLARLVAPPTDHPDLGTGRDAVARVIAEQVVARRDTAAFSQTRQALAGAPLMCCTLVALLAGHEPGPTAALNWLRPVTGGLLDPFTVTTSPVPTAVQPGQVGMLVQHDEECVRLLLTAASTAGRLDQVLPGFAGWITGAVAHPVTGTPARTQYWRDALMALPAHGAATSAWIDLILLALRADPRFLLDAGASVPGYGRAFADGWNQLAAGLDGQVIDEMLTTALINYLHGRPWSRDQARASTVADIVERLAAGGGRGRLESLVAATMAASPGARAWQAVTGWLDRLRQDRPDAVQEGTFLMLRESRADADAGELAELCVQAFANGLPARETAVALAESGAVRTGADATRVLAELRRMLPESEQAAEWLLEFIHVNANGTVGWSTAREFRELSVAQSLNEIEYRLRLLLAGAGGGQSGTAPPTLPDDAVRRLEHIGKTVEQLIRAARPRSGWLWSRKDDERPGETADTQPGHGAGT